jgi:hypothetical protein
MAASSPPQVGVPVNKAALDAKIGSNAQALKKAAVGLADLADWGAAYTDTQLVDLYGFSPEEALLFKSALAEVPSITGPVDALAFLSKCWGA